VIKTIWGSGWDPLIARDSSGLLLKRMEEAVDGEYQDFKSKNGAYVREKFFGKYPELLEMVARIEYGTARVARCGLDVLCSLVEEAFGDGP
jgi:pyruvate dehydrogenase complex dehydrogenase (E1) component